MKGWKTVALGDYADSVDYGVTASATQQPSGPKFLRITDIQNGEVNWKTVPWCECDARSASGSRLQPGDIVFARTGATTGKSFLIRECPKDAVFASYLIRVRVGASVDSGYLSHFFNSPNYWEQITQCARGVAQPGVNATSLKTLKLPLPPLPEQKRIAAILDKADSIRRKRQVAVRLTEELLRSVFLDMFGDPVMNPKGWKVKPLCELVNFTTGKLDSNAAVIGGAYPFFTCSRDDLQIDTYAFDCEALLLAGNNASADYSVKYYKGKFNAYQRTYVITMASPSLSYHYMQYALEMKLLDMKRLSKGTNTKYLTLGILDELPFQVPDKATQTKFENIIDKLNITAAKLRLAESVADKSFNSLLQGAFKGEL